MDKQATLKKLLDGMNAYVEKAKFSRVAPIVREAVLLATVTQSTTVRRKGYGEEIGQTIYCAGYIDAILNVVERIAPQAEANILLPVLWAAKDIVSSKVVDSNLILTTIEGLAA